MNRLTFEQEKKLIDYFRDHQSLWNTKDKDYNNRTLRAQKLEVIAKQMNLNRKDVYEKYRNLRTTFFREHKRVTSQQLQPANEGSDNGENGGTGKGSSCGPRYVSRWRHYHNMMFLTLNAAHNNSKNNSMPNGINGDEGLATNRRQTTTNACQMTIMSNDDSVSLSNGNEIELIEDNGGSRQSHHQQQILHQHHHVLQPTTANSEEIILINSTTGQPIDPNTHQHNPQTMAIQLGNNNVGIITNHDASQQRIFNSINSTTSSSQSIMSTIPIASVIQAATATNVASAQNIIQNVNGHRVGGGIHIDQQSSHSSPKPQPAVLIKYNNGTSTPIFMAAANQPPNPMQSTTTTGVTGSGQRAQQNLNQQTQLQSATFSDFINANQSQQQLGTSIPTTARKSSASIVLVSTPTGSIPATAIHTKENVSTNLTHQQFQFKSVSPTSFEMAAIQAQQQQFLRSSTTTPPRQQQQASLVLNGNGEQMQLQPQHSSPTVILTQNPLMPLANSTPIKNHLNPSVNQTNESSNGVSSGSTYGNISVLDIGEIREVIKNLVQESEDAEMAFCRSLAASLRTLDRSAKDLAKLELQQVIVRYTNPNYSGGNGSSFSSSSFAKDGISLITAAASEASTNPNSLSSTSSSSTITTTASNAVSTIMMAFTGQQVATQSANVPETHQQHQDLQKMITTAKTKTSTTIISMNANNHHHNNNNNNNNNHDNNGDQQKMETNEDDDGSSGS